MGVADVVIGGAGALASGALGLSERDKATKLAAQNFQAAVSAYLSAIIPDPAQQAILLKQYKVTGKMDPRLEQAFKQAKTHMSEVQGNPALEDAQMSALSSLQNIAQNGGHTLEQDAYLNKLQQQVNAENRGRQGAIEQKYASRGMGQPGGLALAAEEMNNQSMTEKENQASMDAAAQAQHNALGALQSEGDLAGKKRTQDFNQAASVAQAKDSIDRFNTEMAQGVESRNTATANKAQQLNLENEQRVADKNTETSNYQERYNKELQQKQYENQLARARGVSGAYASQGGFNERTGENDANAWGNIGQGFLKTSLGVGDALGKQKKDVTEDATPGEPTAGESWDDSTWS
jgi:hypothetical protein